LNDWCAQLGRDPSAIERTVSIQSSDLGDLDAFVAAGAQHVILELGAPFDMAPVRRLVGWRDAQVK
jgi:hypothetical protein